MRTVADMFRVFLYIQWRTCLERYYTYSGEHDLGVIVHTVANMFRALLYVQWQTCFGCYYTYSGEHV